MNARTANSQFIFELPSLSYIDASWEELDPRTLAKTARPVRKTGLAGWFASRLEALRSWRRTVQASFELEMMSDRQLMDIGISRSDLDRVFKSEFNQDLRERGGLVRDAGA
jgi:uncharacterized protein YjiS (DUF1127 family)